MERLQLGGLTMLHAQELRRALIDAGVRTADVRIESEVGELKGGRHGIEPLTLIAITLGPQALVVIGAWLLKTVRRTKKKIDFELVKSDGTKVRLKIEDIGSTEASAGAEILRALQAVERPAGQAEMTG